MGRLSEQNALNLGSRCTHSCQHTPMSHVSSYVVERLTVACPLIGPVLIEM